MSQGGNMVLREAALLVCWHCGVYYRKTNKKYPDTQFSAFLSSDWTMRFSLGLHVIEEDKGQSGEETTAVVENENQYFCRGGVRARREEK